VTVNIIDYFLSKSAHVMMSSLLFLVNLKFD
jgi:hypothetical protein